MRFSRRMNFCWLLVLILLQLISCSTGDIKTEKSTETEARVEHREVTVDKLISHLPAEIIKAGGEIKVRFRGKEAEDQQIGVRMHRTNFSFCPPISGYQVWLDSYTIAFHPETGMERNREYTGVLDVEKLLPELK